MDVGVNDVEQNAFGICIHFLYIVDTFHRFFVVRSVFPGRTQEIYAGDSLKLQVYGKYLEDRNQKANAGSFMTAGGKEKLVADLNELAISTQRAGGANPIALLNLADILAKDLQKKEAPEAYLMYALYDQDSNRYEVGKKVLSRNAANQHEVLEENMYTCPPEEGFPGRISGDLSGQRD